MEMCIRDRYVLIHRNCVGVQFVELSSLGTFVSSAVIGGGVGIQGHGIRVNGQDIVCLLYTSTKADFTALAAALFMCYDPLKRLGVTLTNLKSAYASLERINYLLKEPDTMPEAADPVPMGRAAGRLDYDGVSFSYRCV